MNGVIHRECGHQRQRQGGKIETRLFSQYRVGQDDQKEHSVEDPCGYICATGQRQERACCRKVVAYDSFSMTSAQQEAKSDHESGRRQLMVIESGGPGES